MKRRFPDWLRARGELLSWTRDWGGLLTVAAALFFVYYVLWLFVVQPTEQQKVWLTDLAQPAVSLLMTILAWRASRQTGLDKRKRRAWMILTVAFAMYFLGNVLWGYYELVVRTELAVTWADVPYLSYYPLALIGLLSFPMGRAGRSRLTFALDAGTVMLAASIVIWYLVLRPVALAEHTSGLETSVTLAYPVANTVLLFGVIAVLLRRPPENARRALTILLVAIVFDVIADFGYAYQTLQNNYFGGQWPDCFYMLGFVLMAVSAQYQVYSIGKSRRTQPDEGREKSPFSWLPYAAVGIAYALLLAVDFKFQREHGNEPIVWLALGAFLITAMVVARQIVAVRENSRLLAEKAARESEIRFAALVQHSSDAISILDKDGYLRYTSPANLSVFGYGADEMQDTQLREMIHPEDRQSALDAVAEVTNEPGKSKSPTVRVRHRNDTWIHVESVLTNLLDQPSIAGIVINSRDVTERKKAEEALRDSEERLRQSQKMEAIGQLAGGIAHDFNNLLAVIIGYADMLLRRPADERTAGQLSEIKKAGDRAKALTSQLLAFSRKQMLQPKVLDLNIVIHDLEKMLRRLIGENIEMNTLLQDDIGSVKADPGQIEQVLLNLVVNARDAMPEGGNLTVKTTGVRIDDGSAQSNMPLKPGPYVAISVSDTGCGMSEELQSRIFEPFFTTKETGRGTGLGLSTVYGIVQQSNGHVQVLSKPGDGTTFKIYLPRVDEAAKEEKRSAGTEVAAGTETVLLVEDEEAVRHMAQEILKSNGYKVLNASDGAEAVELSAEYDGPIDVMVTDVVMPRLGGREVAEKLSSTRPDMRVLYMSGYMDDAIVRHGVLDGRAAFLEKPFTPDALTVKIREVLAV